VLCCLLKFSSLWSASRVAICKTDSSAHIYEPVSTSDLFTKMTLIPDEVISDRP
jgi:hypothetical protein